MSPRRDGGTRRRGHLYGKYAFLRQRPCTHQKQRRRGRPVVATCKILCRQQPCVGKQPHSRNHLQQAGEGPVRHPGKRGVGALRPEQELLENRSQLVRHLPRREPGRPDQPRFLLHTSDKGGRGKDEWKERGTWGEVVKGRQGSSSLVHPCRLRHHNPRTHIVQRTVLRMQRYSNA